MSALSSVITQFVRDLLAPPGEICLTCGSKSRLTREWPGICRRCAESIPWIGKPRCVYCGRACGCPDCLREEARQRSFLLNRSAVQYDDMMREWLAQYKYRGNERYARLLIRMISQALTSMQKEMPLLLGNSDVSGPGEEWKPDLITYVPVSTERLMERGFNQAEVLAEGIGKIHHLPVVPLLVRSEHTGKQSFKTRSERVESMQHAFDPDLEGMQILAHVGKRGRFIQSQGDAADRSEAAGALRVLIVDDIYTTGSTINTCAGRIQEMAQYCTGAPAEVVSLTWARS